MRITLSPEDIHKYADRYSGPKGYDELILEFSQASQDGYITRDLLLRVAKWKWQGPIVHQLCAKNSEAEICEISRASLSAKSERLKIGALLCIHGVNWPMASVLLHFVFPNLYPILDKRVMETVGGSIRYNFDRWSEYTKLCQDTAKNLGISIRTLDRALWQYDKERERFSSR